MVSVYGRFAGVDREGVGRSSWERPWTKTYPSVSLLCKYLLIPSWIHGYDLVFTRRWLDLLESGFNGCGLGWGLNVT